jgi:hypothetical protein
MSEEQRTALDDIRTFNRRRGPRCGAGLMLAAMDPELRKTVEQAAADPTIEHRAIVMWLKSSRGIDMSYDSFRRHFRKECQCG